MLQTVIDRTVEFCIRHAWAVVIAALVLAAAAGVYSARHFAINTDINDLLSSQLPWRQRDIAYRSAFPQSTDLILVVLEGHTPEQASGAARALVQGLQNKPDVFHSVALGGGGSFFARNGLLYLSADALTKTTGELEEAGPLIDVLASDPSLRGVVQALTLSLAGIRDKRITLDAMAPILTLASDTLEGVAAGRPAIFSWKAVLQGGKARPSDLRQIVTVWPVLDQGALQPGGRATAEIGRAIADLKLASTYDVTASITGPVAISDDQFATLQQGATLNSVITGLIVLAILWLALRSLRLVGAVVFVLAAGLVLTTATGLLILGAFNPISAAFAVLFIGLGADFAIQFSVRYRAQRSRSGDLKTALLEAAGRVGVPLTLAAAAAAVGFLSFMPTAYTGLAQLGIIAGCGMVFAYALSLTALPALIRLVRPPAEPHPLRQPRLAPVDHFLRRHRFVVVAVTALIALGGLPALTKLQFDFNPLDINSRSSPAIAALLRLGSDPALAVNAAEVVVNSDQEAAAAAKKLAALPAVASARSIASFVPEDQDRKLQIIRAAHDKLAHDLAPTRRPAPSDDDDVAALKRGAQSLGEAASDQHGAGADAAHRLADDLTKLASADPAQRQAATAAFVRPLQESLEGLQQSLEPQRVTRASLPQDLVRAWVAPDGRQRVEAIPKGDANDTITIVNFARAVLAVEPAATGQAIETFEWGETMLRALEQAAALALGAIAILLFLVLRRVTDVLITLVPLITAGLVTLEICALTNFPLNYANIIALPVLLGVGVAFKIYYITAWRRGQTEFLQSALTRAVFFSALLTATAFGSLWLSSNPGISSMGRLLALSLACTLVAAALFQPALMGEPRKEG